MNTTTIFSALDASGVSICDFARLTTISRVTLHRWKAHGGCNIRDQRALRIALTYADRLTKAFEAGRLPLKDRYLTAQRLKVLQGIIAEMNRNS